MAGRNLSPFRIASCSRIFSMSSMNLRNITQTSMGKRSRSPERPLSLRMMSRQDLMMLPSCCAVVSWASVDVNVDVDADVDLDLRGRAMNYYSNYQAAYKSTCN